MKKEYNSQKEKRKDNLTFAATTYGLLEVQNRKANRKRSVPSGRIKFSDWEYNPIDRVLHFKMHTPDDSPVGWLYICWNNSICTPSGSKEWTEGYTKLYEQYHSYDEEIDISPDFVYGEKRHIELEVLEAFKPTIPRSFSGKLKNDKKIFYDLPAPSDDVTAEVKEFYLMLKDLVDKQNEELKDFVYDEDALIRKMCPEKNDFVQAGHCFEKK